MWLQPALGFVLAAVIGLAAYWRGSLSPTGVAGAVLVGTLVFGLGGWGPGLLLVAFFVSSSALSHFREARKEALAEKFSKGHRRDLGQVLANGGLAALAALGAAVWPGSGSLWWLALAGALAAVTADTWATELGVLSRTPPRLLTTGRVVEPGTSGALSGAGTLAAAAGAALIGVIAALFGLGLGPSATPLARLGLAGAVTLAGLLGSLFDSLLGATVQAIYRCERCGRETERHPTHRCGGHTRLARGWAWLSNDWVNFAASVVGSLVAVGFGRGL